mmetsp:Transcript_26853/g.64984  ORF Transcript_26853/g.64984 Transcript_26853/m.64984 type:complete len:89 (-) Transcript_26853:68-334(-)
MTVSTTFAPKAWGVTWASLIVTVLSALAPWVILLGMDMDEPEMGAVAAPGAADTCELGTSRMRLLVPFVVAFVAGAFMNLRAIPVCSL